MSIYTDNGYENREEYLNKLREDYGGLVDFFITILPESEDFDGLIVALDDAVRYAMMLEDDDLMI
jgi:hypothetical protein